MIGSGNNILITGFPGVGKTTLIRRLCDRLEEYNPVGFYTAELRERGLRCGFELISLSGDIRQVLSHVNIKSEYRVGKYGVDIPGFDAYLQLADLTNTLTGLVIIDEIGKMECLSDRFKTTVMELLDSDKTVIATIAQKGGGLIAGIKRRTDIELFETNLQNRDKLLPEILARITPARADEG